VRIKFRNGAYWLPFLSLTNPIHVIVGTTKTEFFFGIFTKLVNPRSRLVMAVHNPDASSPFFKSRILRLSSMVDRFVFLTKQQFDSLGGLLGARGSLTTFVPNGIDVKDVHPNAPERSAMFVFGFLGRLVPQKGLAWLLDSCLELKSGDWSLLIAGDGPDSNLVYEDKYSTIRNRVKALGPVPYDEFFELVNCLIVPSKSEAFPLVVAECQISGLPLIVSGVGAVPEMVAGTSALICNPNEPETLVNAMVQSLLNPIQRYANAQLDIEKVREKYDVDVMVQKYEKTVGGSLNG
jgi:glycosyltransferase involved in cell wall biosynthesis